MTDLTATPLTLAAVAKTAMPGDRILLTSGSYGAVSLSAIKAAPGVQVLATPGATVIFASLTFTGAGYTVRGKEILVKVPPTLYAKAVQLSGQDNHVDGIRIVGDPASYFLDTAQQIAVLARYGKNVSVKNCDIAYVKTGASISSCDGFAIDGNSFHGIRTDGVFVSGSSNGSVQGNSFTDFHFGQGDHPDAIQFTTVLGSILNVKIKGNRFVKGPGNPAQGVFCGNENALTKGTLYENIVIEDNAFVGPFWTAAAIGGAKNCVIRNNFAQGSDDAIANGQLMDKPKIGFVDLGVPGEGGNVLVNNIAPTMLLAKSASASGNSQPSPLTVHLSDTTQLDAWWAANNSSPQPGTVEDPAVIAQLQQQLAAMTAERDALTQQVTDLQTQLSAAVSAQGAVQHHLDIARGDLAEDRGAMSQAVSLLSTALANNPEGV